MFSKRLVLRATACVALAAGTARTARADLFGLVNPATGPFGVVHYDNSGRLVRVESGVSESTDGLTSTPDGWLYVAGNILGDGYLARSRADGPIVWQSVTPPFGGPYKGPSGLATGPDGSIYATSNTFGFGPAATGVFRYNPADGSFTQIVNVPDAAPFSLGRVAVAPGGDIYLAHSGVGIERYAGDTGQFLGVLIPGAARDMDFGPDGNLYVPTSAGVDRYNPLTGALIDHFIPNGSGALNGASELTFGAGLLFVQSPAVNAVFRYDAVTGAFHDTFVTPDQYVLGRLRGASQMTFVVPDPSALGFLAFASLALLRHRSPRAHPPQARRIYRAT